MWKKKKQQSDTSGGQNLCFGKHLQLLVGLDSKGADAQRATQLLPLSFFNIVPTCCLTECSIHYLLLLLFLVFTTSLYTYLA